jgi:hypothetical protein
VLDFAWQGMTPENDILSIIAMIWRCRVVPLFNTGVTNNRSNPDPDIRIYRTMKKPTLPSPPPFETNTLRFDANNPGRKCRNCREYRVNADYETHRHKVCLHCKLKRVMRSLSGSVKLLEAERKASGEPAITMTREGRNKYYRERYREQRGQKENTGPRLSHRMCRMCRVYKPITEFLTDWTRICLKCDGPDSWAIRWRNPQRVR